LPQRGRLPVVPLPVPLPVNCVVDKLWKISANHALSVVEFTTEGATGGVVSNSNMRKRSWQEEFMKKQFFLYAFFQETAILILKISNLLNPKGLASPGRKVLLKLKVQPLL